MTARVARWAATLLTVALLGGACGGAAFDQRVAVAPAATTTSTAPPTLDAPAAPDMPAPASALPGLAPSGGGGGGRTVRAAPGGPAVTGRIEIPKIGLNHITYEGNTLAQINHGPSHWPGTPMPGHAGNSVYPGHRTTHSRPFYFINDLVAGDQIIFTTNEGRFVYEVYEAFTVRPHEMWIVENTANPIVTIFACHPRGSAKFRYVVRAKLTSPQAAARPAPAPRQQPQPQPNPAPQPPSTQPPPPSTTPTTKPCLVCL